VVTAFCLNLVNEASLRPRRRSLVRELRDENWRTAALDVMVAATQDDTDPPTLSAFDDGEGPPTVSSRCMKAFADTIWAVYNMREMWRSLGPRIETVHKATTPGRNAPCLCGSGKNTRSAATCYKYRSFLRLIDGG
jgi:uncharacterized protein